MYKIGWEFEDGSVTGRTLLGILRGGVGCGNPKLKDIPKWWMRVSKTLFKSQNNFFHKFESTKKVPFLSEIHRIARNKKFTKLSLSGLEMCKIFS